MTDRSPWQRADDAVRGFVDRTVVDSSTTPADGTDSAPVSDDPGSTGTTNRADDAGSATSTTGSTGGSGSAGKSAAPPRRREPNGGNGYWIGRLFPLVLLVLLILLPWMQFSIPGVLPGVVNSPGSMRLLAMCLVTAGIALSYDVLFGRTGLLSFGHALFVGAGAYAAAIALRDWGSLWLALLAVLVVGVALPLIVGAVSLRVKGIAFAMVTLAFAQAVAITVTRNPGNETGGEEGLPLSRDGLPDMLIGVANAPYRYWVALAFCVLCIVVVGWLTRSRAGHAWAAVRENEDRVEVLGVSAYRAKLLAVVVGGLLGTIGGMVQLLVVGGTHPGMLSTEFTLSLLVMVVLGGAGSRWGAVIGGALYALLDSRLGELATSQTIADLPAVLRVPLSQPLFVFGLLFILIVYFAPGGITSIGRRIRDAVVGRRAAHAQHNLDNDPIEAEET